MMDSIKDKLKDIPGKMSVYYKNLVTGSVFAYNENEPMLAASVIKLFIMTDAFRRREAGILDFDSVISISKDKCVPSCGALTYLHDGVEVTVRDLITLMIILSDNTATNYLIDILGIDSVNECIKSLGFHNSVLTRKMFDSERAALGYENYISCFEVSCLLEMMYNGDLISKSASEEMVSILKNQRLNGKIPFLLHSLENSPAIAHKTGEDSCITHDVGIVFAKEPFVVSFCSNETDVPRFERFIQDTALALFTAQ